MPNIEQLLSIHPRNNQDNKTNDNNNNKDNNNKNNDNNNRENNQENRRTNDDYNRNNQDYNTSSDNQKINKEDLYIVISFVDLEPKTTKDTCKRPIYNGCKGVCCKQKRYT